jgi:hypothetical protein
VTTEDFENECKALKECEASGHTPRFFYSAELRQNNYDPFPGGYLRVLVMSEVPGQSVIDLFGNLTQEDLSIIRRQLTETLE